MAFNRRQRCMENEVSRQMGKRVSRFIKNFLRIATMAIIIKDVFFSPKNCFSQRKCFRRCGKCFDAVSCEITLAFTQRYFWLELSNQAVRLEIFSQLKFSHIFERKQIQFQSIYLLHSFELLTSPVMLDHITLIEILRQLELLFLVSVWGALLSCSCSN